MNGDGLGSLARSICESLEKIKAGSTRIEEVLRELSSNGDGKPESSSTKAEAALRQRCISERVGRLEETSARVEAALQLLSTDDRIDRVEAISTRIEASLQQVALQQLSADNCIDRVALQQLLTDDRVKRMEAVSARVEGALQQLSMDDHVERILEAVSAKVEGALQQLSMDDRAEKVLEAVSARVEGALQQLSTDARTEKILEASWGKMEAALQELSPSRNSELDCFSMEDAMNDCARLKNVEATAKAALLEVSAIKKPLRELVAEVQSVPLQGLKTAEWDLSDANFDGKTSVLSSPFTLAGVHGLQLDLAPQGSPQSTPGHASLYLHGPADVSLKFRLTLDSATKQTKTARLIDQGHGWADFCTAGTSFRRVGVEVLEVIRQVQSAEAQAC